MSGEADLSTADVLRRAIAVLPPDADEIHLQLAGLDFIDVDATRELITLTSRPGRPRLVLHYPPPSMLELLAVCWPETRAQFVIGAPRPRRTGSRGPFRPGQPVRVRRTWHRRHQEHITRPPPGDMAR